MAYARGYPVRPVGGRLALDFLNTADWGADGAVTHEKIGGLDDFAVWCEAMGLDTATLPATVDEVLAFRRALRPAFLQGECGLADVPHFASHLRALTGRDDEPSLAVGLPALSLIAASALAILSDPRERARVKLCPGHDCGWLFLDETKNARRTWCRMETCGNRAKAARHYARRMAGRKAEA